VGGSSLTALQKFMPMCLRVGDEAHSGYVMIDGCVTGQLLQ